MYSILYVDDEESLLKIGKIYLERDGNMVVETLTSPREALDRIDSVPFDAVIADYQMPEMDGIEFLKAIRSRYSDLPFILFTGKGREEVVIQAINYGADFYLQKGGDPKAQFAELILKIRQAVQRHNAESELSKSEANLQAIISNTDDIIASYDTDIRLQVYNRAASETYRNFFGIELKPGLSTLEFFPESMRGFWIANNERALAGESFSVEFNLQGTSGHERFFESSFNPIRKSGVITGFSTVTRDITERKRAEKVLREDKEKFRNFFNDTGDAITIHDLQGHFLEVNDEICRRLGYSREEMMGMSPGDIDEPEYGELVPARIQELQQTGHIVFETVHRTKDGTLIPTEVSSRVIMYNGVPAVLSTGRDITDRKMAEKDLAAALKRTRDQQVALATVSFSPLLFSGDVHELSTTITEISSGVLGVERASVWLFNGNGDELRCIDLYETSRDRHSGGSVLGRHEYVNEFDALSRAKYIDANDPLSDPRTAGYVEGYLRPNRITSMLDAVIRVSGQSLGVLCFEHVNCPHHWESDEIAFACQLADQIAISLLNQDRKMAEKALRESEERYRILAEASPDQIFINDREDTIQYVNSAALELFRLPYDQVIGKPRKNFFPPEIAKSQEINLQKVFKTGESVRSEDKIQFGRTELWVDVNLVPLKDKAGDITSVLGIARDITERKQAEKELWENRQRFQGLVETLYDWIWEVDPEGHYTYVSPRVKDLLGYEPEELLGKTPFDLMPEEEAKNISEIFGSLLAEQKPLSALENINIHKDGHLVIMETNGLPFYDAQGNFKGYQGIDRDITRRKELEQEMQFHEQELMEFSTSLASANKKLNLLSSITRHDINNQLTVQMGYLSMLEQNQLDPEQAEYFQKVSTAAERISAMIRFTKEYEEIGVHAPVWQDCRTLVDTAVKDSHLGKVTVINDLPQKTELFADPLITRVFYNLADNAARYGKKITTLRFFSEVHGDEHVIVCEDDGDGIPATEKERIFDRGYGKNTGMGLFLSREILAITGITIHETGKPGKGARFEITVPKKMWR